MDPEKLLGSRRIYEGRVIRVREDTVALCGGGQAKREVVEHPGATAIVAITPQGEIAFVRQYRRAIDRYILEIPAGKLEPGEEPADCARRELLEETGLLAQDLKPLAFCYTTPGFTDEQMHIFFTNNVQRGNNDPRDDERLEVLWIPAEEAFRMLERGEFVDAKTLIGLLLAGKVLEDGKVAPGAGE